MPEYEVKTMKKDIERMRRKARISEPIVTRKEEAVVSLPPKPSLPPKKFPIPYRPGRKPGVPLPAEPIATTRRPEAVRFTEPEIEAKELPRRKRIPLPIILIITALIIGGGFYYGWNYLKFPHRAEAELPASFIEVERTEIIELKQGKETKLFEELKEKAGKFQETDTFRRILVEKIAKEKNYFLGFGDFSQILALNIPADVSKSLAEESTLFFYAQAVGEEQGNRFGAIIKIKDAIVLKDYLKVWEGKMRTDLNLFFLGQEPGEPTAEKFQDNTYKDIKIRYLGFSNPSFGINYAIVKDYLVITTSKESMFGVIDRVLGE